ncbi:MULTISPECIES: F0F1 ATP synthase subunit delta [Legionella]|uniref:ATP synthase subunit delta n=1 Tax=Legionella septentrionalis TaxID=2498109 RepID=A0A3S0VAV6_9GAMM|nr:MULTISPECIES: F0F1 ATP synthase subunit delta [Legionella]MCP0914882.1 F0F1 ATP synthase subunit delta [Legionella sp. 27cVA30]RUQ88831.1 F0F1 ATP synthase subunit delta [Legionella septentrionalis]RUR02944.1 F0F1 ATP synthase subunit delta [Legionella septentrionalis]RUR11543.1 F0F1 ATP synthase subunit delta [Legionella septentrionalis]RUR16808.1 F0F1 ATP synthase subunit delta [Legionella septentrionalis]
MSETIARPYAKAIFEHALAAKQLVLWSTVLKELALAVQEPDAKKFVSNPTTSAELKTKLLLSIFAQADYQGEMNFVQSFIALLAENKRLMVLPDISALYEALRAEQEKTLVVQVLSFSELTPVQQERLVKSLSQRLHRQIALDIKIDKSLLGGAIVRAGDLVIDGSVRGKLNKLGTNLAA